jgi:hypothetical protein
VLGALLTDAALFSFDVPSAGAAAHAASEKHEMKESVLRKEIIISSFY